MRNQWLMNCFYKKQMVEHHFNDYEYHFNDRSRDHFDRKTIRFDNRIDHNRRQKSMILEIWNFWGNFSSWPRRFHMGLRETPSRKSEASKKKIYFSQRDLGLFLRRFSSRDAEMWHFGGGSKNSVISMSRSRGWLNDLDHVHISRIRTLRCASVSVTLWSCSNNDHDLNFHLTNVIT